MPEPRAGVGSHAALCKDSKGSHADLGKMPPWHQSQALHAPCLSFPTGETALAQSHWGTLSHSAQPSLAPAQCYCRPGTSPPSAAGCGSETCCARKGVVLSQLAQLAPPGSSTRWHSPTPEHEEGSWGMAPMAEQGCFPGLIGRHAHCSFFPGRMSPPWSLLSGKHPGGEAELPHSLFWAAFPHPPSPRVPHSYCLCRNSVAINPPMSTGAACLCFPASSPSPPRAICGAPHPSKKILGVSYCLARERRGTVQEAKPQCLQPSLPQHREAHPHRHPGGSQECPTRPLS